MRARPGRRRAARRPACSAGPTGSRAHRRSGRRWAAGRPARRSAQAATSARTRALAPWREARAVAAACESPLRVAAHGVQHAYRRTSAAARRQLVDRYLTKVYNTHVAVPGRQGPRGCGEASDDAAVGERAPVTQQRHPGENRRGRAGRAGRTSPVMRAARAAAAAAAAAAAPAATVASLSGIGPITFATGKVDTAYLPALLAQWNAAHPRQRVTLIQL